MTTKYDEFINLNDYSQYLPRHKRRGYRVCPVCAGKLDIHATDGKKFTCYSSECDRGEIRRAVLALAGENPTWENDPEQVAKREERDRHEREVEAVRIAGLKPEAERDRQWRGIIANSFLSDCHRQDMLARGWTDEQILISNARSSSRGRMIPIRTATGKYVGSQVITKDSKRWYSCGDNQLKETGELPLAVVYTENPRVGIIYLCEGTLDKVWLCAFRHNVITIGSSNVGSNPKDLERTLKTIEEKQGWQEIEIQYVMMGDGGAVLDKGVMIRYGKLSRQFTELGKKLQFGWWKQIEKGGNDIDEIDPATKIQYISSDRFFAIGRSQMEKKELKLAAEEWKTRQTAADLELWKTLNKLSHKPDDLRDEEFLKPLPLPKAGTFTFISSNCGTGKTHQLPKPIDDWLKINPNGKLIAIVHRNSIKDGMQTRLNIPEYKVGFGQNGTSLNDSQKVCVCVDSSLQLDLNEISPNTLLVLDECEAILKHASCGGTLGSNTASVQAHFAAIIDRVQSTGGAVIALEDSVTDLAIDGYHKLTGNRYQHELIVNTRERFCWDVKMGAGSIKHFATKIVNHLKLGENLIVPCSSQKMAETLHLLVKAIIPAIADNIERLDGKTAPDLHDLLQNPTAYFSRKKTRLFLYTTTMESGASIDAGFFDRRMAYFVNLETRSQIQMLYRDRSNIPTDIYIKSRGAEANGLSKDPHKLFKIQKQIASTTAMAQGRGQILNNKIGEVWNELEAQFTARETLSANHMSEYLEADLSARGHSVTQVSWADENLDLAAKLAELGLEPENPDLLDDRMKEIKLEILVSENRGLFLANGKSIHPEQAIAMLHSSGVRLEDRQKAIKCLLHRDLPDANLTEDFLMTAITENRGQYRKACELSWMVEHPDLAHKLDRNIFANQLESPHIVYSRVPKNQQRAELILPMLEHLATLMTGQYDNETSAVLKIQEYTLKNSYKFKTLLRLEIKPESLDAKGRRVDTPITTVNKLLKKLGYEIKSNKQGARGAQVTVYSVANADCPHRQTIYKALDRKHSTLLAENSVSTGCINYDVIPDVNTDLDLHPDPHPEVDRVKLASAIDLLGEAANASMPDAIETFGEFRTYYPSDVFNAAIASLRKTRGEWIDLILARLNTADRQAA